MADDVVLNKAASVERCVARALEEYEADPQSFTTNFSRQDAAILNIQRACEACLDVGQHIIRRESLGLPQSARDIFTLLAQSGWIDEVLANAMKRMVGFRNIAVHEYQALQLPILLNIIKLHLADFSEFSRCILLKDASHNP